ncbi:hypothetical protein BJY22_006845 [Kribbella shirazensis]|uniref:Uncharacterized protein n=1 Tax=Kribbella shirazensis TaxID=1105143 RepID=A0A7X6A4N7_9ACTN|nr:hypothetical protein [Kribbella shirazensis]
MVRGRARFGWCMLCCCLELLTTAGHGRESQVKVAQTGKWSDAGTRSSPAWT